MNKKIIGASALLATGLVAGGLFSVGSIANAADNTTASTSSTVASSTGTATPPTFGNDQGRAAEVAITGDNLTKLTDAALAKYPGATVLRAEEDADGAKYEVHLKKADGSIVTVEFDADFNITGTHEGFGKGGPHGAPSESLATGDTADKIIAAAKAKVADATVIRAEVDSDGSAYEVHMKKADGSVVTVKFDADLNVTGVEDGFGAGGPQGGHGPRGGDQDGDGGFQLPSQTPSTTGSNG